jgi:hypothetical protein
MLTNQVRRDILNRVKASGFPGGVSEAFRAAEQGVDIISQYEEQQSQQQPQAPMESQAPVAPPMRANTQPSFSPSINIPKTNTQDHLVESHKSISPQIQDLPTGSPEGEAVGASTSYKDGGFTRETPRPMIQTNNFQFPKSFIEQNRRKELKEAIDLVSSKEAEGTQENMKSLLTRTNFMENSMGYNSDAYNRGYTNSQASIDPIMFTDLFSPRVDENGKSQGFTATQKKHFKRLEELGLPSDSVNFKKELQRNNPLAATYAMRMAYGRSEKAIPNRADTLKSFEYYDEEYRKNLEVTDKTKSRARFYEGSKIKYKKGGFKSKYTL